MANIVVKPYIPVQEPSPELPYYLPANFDYNLPTQYASLTPPNQVFAQEQPNVNILPAEQEYWTNQEKAGMQGVYETLAKPVKKLLGVGGEERYQTWPERTIRSALALPAEVYKGEVLSGPGLRREDYTDIPGQTQPLDPMIERAQDVAGLAGGTMFAGVKPGMATLGAGPVRKLSKNDLYHGTTIDAAKEIDAGGIEPRIGNFVKKMYGEDAGDELVYLADKDRIKSAFTAIKEQVAQKLNKSQHEVTAKDIEENGVLYAIKKHEYDHYRGTEEGLSRNSKNEIVEETPTGVEAGDWYTRDTVLPDKKVTGKALVSLFNENGVKLLSETSKVGAPLAALEKAPAFYSNVENAVKASKQNVADKGQWLSYLKNQPGVKPEELEWTVGNLPEGKITKQQLEQHIAENKVQLGEVWKKSSSEYPYEGNEWQIAIDRAEAAGNFDEAARIQRAWEGVNESSGSTANQPKYQSYQLPGGEPGSYRELLLTLPDNQFRTYEYEWFDPATQKSKQFKTEAEAKRDAPPGAVIVPKETATYNENFKSSHWDEPNVLAHVRMNDRDIPNVGKSLHIEEIQSDFGQAHRKESIKIKEAINKDFDGIADRMVKAGVIKKICD